MTILLWILQFLLAAHTLMGALWKFSHPAQSLPSLHALPQPGWLGLAVAELLCSVALAVPLFLKPTSSLASVAALVIAAEMFLFCGLHLRSGDPQHSQLVYWLIVAVLCAVIAYGRWTSKTA